MQQNNLLIGTLLGFVLLFVSCSMFVYSVEEGVIEMSSYEILDGGPDQPRPRPEVFSSHNLLTTQNYHQIMRVFREEFEPLGGVIGIEIYYETLIALLDEPEVSVLARFEAAMDVLEHRPFEINLLRTIYFRGNYTTVHFPSDSLRHHIIGRHGRGTIGEMRTHTSFDFLVPDSVVAFSKPDNVASFLAENGVEANVNERHLLIFDDLYAQYMPSTFLWVDTDEGVFFIWMAYSNGPFASFRGDFIARLYTPEEFRASWQTLMCRETMDHNE